MKEFEQTVKEMMRLTDFLMPYINDKEDETILLPLKQREVNVFGHDISLYFTKEKFPEFVLYSLQVYSKYVPFLPFNLVCYCATQFLGERELGLAEFMISGRKIYVWSVAIDKEDNPVPIPLHPKVELCSYNGVSFIYAPTSFVNLPLAF